MAKYIGFEIAYKKTGACVVQTGKSDKYETPLADVAVMRLWLDKQRKPGDRPHLTFEVSGQSIWLHDSLRITWILWRCSKPFPDDPGLSHGQEGRSDRCPQAGGSRVDGGPLQHPVGRYIQILAWLH